LTLALALATVALPIGFAASPVDDDDLTTLTCGDGLSGDEFVRTELFFGLSRPHGRITERQFDRFVDGEVTPRFPDGLTVLSGLGQFRLEDGEIVEEKSKVLVLLHGGGDVASKEIEEIRAEYIEQFDQQSVLRADAPACVSF
jgi:Protein of unknown function (DUF3574)